MMRIPHLAAFALVLSTFFPLVGCGKKDKSESPTPSPSAAAKVDGILLAEPNDKFHIRLIVVKDEKKVVATILDEKASTPVGIEQEAIMLIVKDAKPIQIPLKADGKGTKTSKFAAVHDRFAEALDDGKLEITATIEGKEYHFAKDDHKH